MLLRDILPSEDLKRVNELRQFAIGLRVAFPGLVNAVNTDGTIDVQPCIREKILLKDDSTQYVDLPILPHVPIMVLSSGSCSISMPVAIGDECLIVIADTGIDNWWIYGGVQNPSDLRRHDITDGFAILGFHSNSKAIVPTSDLVITGPDGNKLKLSSSGLTYNNKRVLTEDDLSQT